MKLPGRNYSHVQAIALFVACLAIASPFAVTGAWPQVQRTIKLLVPYPPSAAPDIMARMLGEEIGHRKGVTVVVENRPGAGGSLGTEAVARAAPDGKALLIAVNPFLIDPYVRKVNYDPLTSFEPICYLARTPTVLVVNSASPYHALNDLFDAARAQPGMLTVASAPGPASASHIAFEMLKRAAKIDLTFVPYPGVPPAVNALLGGHVTSMFGAYPAAAEQIKAGKLRALAVGSPERIESLPEVPTLAEAGYGNIEADLWTWLLAPAKTPNEAVVELSDWFSEAMKMPEIKAKLAVQGLYPVAVCGAEFAARMRKESESYSRIIREANIRLE